MQAARHGAAMAGEAVSASSEIQERSSIALSIVSDLSRQIEAENTCANPSPAIRAPQESIPDQPAAVDVLDAVAARLEYIAVRITATL
jgi:hypothetical protein